MIDKMMIEEINRLKKEKKAVILAHYYQNKDVQDIADYVGDSFALSQIAQKTDADIIILCGVHFMAETAKILAPNKKVLIPVMEAGCNMAKMIDENRLKEYKEKNPNTKVVTYVNSTASVKALSDVCVTSVNAVKIIKHYMEEGFNILYCPDQNLGKYVMDKYGFKFDVWPGFCCIHHNLTVSDVNKMKEKYPHATFIAHPECQLPILKEAKFVGSTKQLIEFTKTSPFNEFIIGTEEGVIHEMKKQSPNKKFHLLSDRLVCYDMKLAKLEDVYNVIKNETNEILIDEDILSKAKVSLDEMMKLS